ncbi:transcription termination factor 4, mitochondrial isoform X2 [Hyperolius riggenbachi]|uniref:transcription termination factor 4, mitochondrial isoform X2 n=1 Tax=Hyperolius riggenbachi TaxID=752182 RepID=UPI0035A3AA0B
MSADRACEDRCTMVSICVRSFLHFRRHSLFLRHVSRVPGGRQELLNLDFSEEQAEKILSMKSSAHSMSTITELSVIGLYPKQILKILEEKPEIMRATAKEVRDKADTLRRLGLGEGSLQNAVVRCPALMSIPRSHLLAAVQCLKTRCQFSSQQVLKILRTTPEALSQDPKYLHEVFQYVYFRMGGKHVDMISSGIFQSPLHEIRVRHEFLERLGKFQPPNKKGLCPPTNPKLKEVMQLSEGDFLSHIAHSSPIEFSVFCKILAREEQENAEDAEDEQDESTEEEDGQSEGEDDSDDEIDEQNIPNDQTHKHKNK